MEILSGSQIDREEWNKLVNLHPYYRYEWSDIIKSVYKLEPHYFLAKQEDKFALIGSFKTRNGLVSLPFLSYSGFYSNSPEFLQKFKDQLRSKNIDIDSRDIFEYNDESIYVDSVAEVVSIDEYWKKVSSNTRNQIKKSQKNDFEVRLESDAKNLHSIYSRNMHRLGTPSHSLKFFEKILSSIAESQIISIFSENKAIASMLCFYDDKTLFDHTASTLPEYNRSYANYFLYWEAIQFLKTKNLQFFDMGRSTKDSGTHKFKKKFRPVDYSIRSKINYNKSKLQIVSKVWTNLPYSLTLKLGPIVRKYLP